MEAFRTFETWRKTQRHLPVDLNLQQYRLEKLKYYKKKKVTYLSFYELRTYLYFINPAVDASDHVWRRTIGWCLVDGEF